MLNIHGGESGPFSKADLLTNGIPVERIKGLYRSEEYSWSDAHARWDRDTKEKYGHEELWGQWWSLNAYIDVPIDFVFDYATNVFSVEEWSFGIRDLKHVGNGIYKGRDGWSKGTEVFIRSEAHRDAKAVDYHYAWDQKEELWIRNYFRFIDAKGVINRPGTIMSWSSWKHPYFDKKSAGLPAWLKDSHSKSGREWLGDHWRYFWAWHRSEADNLRYILEHRYHNMK